MHTHDIHPESTPEQRDERGCGHPHHDSHGDHGRRDAHDDRRDQRHGMRDERAPFGRGMRPGRAFGRPMGHGGRGFGPGPFGHDPFGHGPFGHDAGPRPFGPGFGPRRPGAADERTPHGEHGAERRGGRGEGRQRRLDRRILRTARIVAFAEHRAGREAVERTMAASVSHADHEATMRTLRTIARAVRAEHLPGHRHGGDQPRADQPHGDQPHRGQRHGEQPQGDQPQGDQPQG